MRIDVGGSVTKPINKGEVLIQGRSPAAGERKTQRLRKLLALLYQSAKNSGTFYCKSASANLHEGAADNQAFRVGVCRLTQPFTSLAEHAFKHEEEHDGEARASR